MFQLWKPNKLMAMWRHFTRLLIELICFRKQANYFNKHFSHIGGEFATSTENEIPSCVIVATHFIFIFTV